MGIRRYSFLVVVSATVLLGNAFAQQTNTLPATGNVGIGTTSPQYPLDVNGAIRATGSGGYLFNSNGSVYFKELYGPLIGLGGSGAPFGASFINSNGTNVMYVRSDGNVGIGITSPATTLDLGGVAFVGHNGNTAAPSLGATGGSGDKILLWGGSASAYPYSLGINALNMWASVPSGAYFSWYVGGAEEMRINSSGNVGIGTTSPSAPLEVKGNVKLTAGSGASVTYQDGTVQSTAWNGVLQGGDYAESVDVSGDRAQYEPGDVLVIDPSVQGRFLKSSEPYSATVAGIYSTKPGIRGRRQATDSSHMPDEVPMAMIGVVPTKVTAEGGVIKPGDLLVTSSKPGYAMKGKDHTQMMGAIIGKAMGHLDSGTGVMEVLVSLQ